MTQIPSEGPEGVSMWVCMPVLRVCVVGQLLAADLRHLPLVLELEQYQGSTPFAVTSKVVTNL